MEAALAACLRDGGGELSITRVLLEAAVRGGVGDEFTPERVGRWIVASGAVDTDVPVTRRRLLGHIARIYSLRSDGSDPPRERVDPFAFCVANRCADCRFAGVCGDVVPDLQARKRARG